VIRETDGEEDLKMSHVVSVKDVTKDYEVGKVVVKALRGVSLDIDEGEFAAVVGPSGSGKSTLMNLIGGLDVPSNGVVMVGGKDLSKVPSKRLADLRLHNIGFVFQAYNLVPVLSARENVEFVLQLQGVSRAERRTRSLKALEDVGLGDLGDRRPAEMSGGQQQRVAVARAMVAEPKLILADEPTANLDSKTGRDLLDLMRQLNKERGVTFLFSTHDPKVMDYARRIVTLIDGKVERDETKDSGTYRDSGVLLEIPKSDADGKE
jgi:putative ABC transport system ATP-binding protein